MVPTAVLMLLLDIRALARGFTPVTVGAHSVLMLLGVALVGAFYALIICSYLRRGPAVATAGPVTARVVAVVATFTPFSFPLLPRAGAGPARQIMAGVLLLAGTAFAVWALRWLGRNLSVIAQARGVADQGPYRFVRHPLYTGEIVSALGLALTSGTLAAFGLWAALVAMQVYRARAEERVLLQALPGYRDYRARAAALLPRMF
ncbi:MAG TPA: isoprenylcysteine carboxylmethyltransferase family protein [Streptosporangiaceae bacterium]|nr:isoprenylcysteine carboxylmethyltransferase family protein [Streptosporangiaceae bacterium]